MMAQFGRVLTAMVTPFDESGKLDLGQSKRLAEALLASGTEGLVVCGTTGESPTLTTEEKLQLLEATVEVAHARGAHVVAGTTNYNTAESIELSREAAAAGRRRHPGHGSLLQQPAPGRARTSTSRRSRARSTCRSSSTTCRRAPCATWSRRTTLRLARDVDNIVGIKEASANFKQIGEIIRGAPDGFNVWSGNDGDILTILALGGYGVVSVAAHLVGKQIAGLIQAFVDRDTVAAARLHHSLMPLVDALFFTTSPIPLKYALNKIGHAGRQPAPAAGADRRAQSGGHGRGAGEDHDRPAHPGRSLSCKS